MHPAFSIVARIAKTDVKLLQPGQTLGSLNISKSLGINILRSAVERRFACKLPAINWQTTLQQLVDKIDQGADPSVTKSESDRGTPAPRAPADQTEHPGSRFRTLGHGIDIQDIASLPELDGGWENHPFYQTHFTTAELAHAREKPDVRRHLAGLWCAKEAIKKSDPGLLSVDFSDIRIVHDTTGRPSAHLEDVEFERRYEITVSISHSTAYAVGSAITVRR